MLQRFGQYVAAVFGPPNLELRRRLLAVERRLAASERRYRQLVHAASEAILVARRDGRLIEANEAACALLGYTRSELLELRPESLLAEGAESDGIDALRLGETVTAIRRLRRRDGTLVEVEGSAKILPDGRFQAIVRDIGERRRMEEALRESERRLRRLTASARAVVYRYRLQPERRIEFVSDEVTELTGFTPEEHYADPGLIWGRIHPDDAHLLDELFAPALFRYSRRDGEQLWFERINLPVHDAHGRLVAIEGVARDVTEQKQAEEALQASERFLRAVFESAAAGITVVDDDRVVVDANETACEIFGLPGGGLIGRRVDEVSSDPERTIELWSELRAHGLLSGTFELPRLDGGQRTLEFSARADVLPGKHVAVFQDVTERRALAERLRQSERMEAVGRLAGGVAHDFNNLLTVITGYSDVLERRLPDESARREVEEIRRAAARATALTAQLLAYSRRQVLQPRSLELNAVVRDLDRMLRRLIGDEVDLVLELEDGLAPVVADESRVEQVIVNLAVNARDAMPGGGRLTITTATVELVEALPTLEEPLPPGRYARLTLSDTGSGIPQEILDSIFEPFFTTKGQGRGTGLGLATAYGIARQSGGTLLVESTPGAGASFHLYLPRAAPDGDPEPPSGLQQDEPARTGSETVLLVEDDDLVRELVEEVLVLSGYRVLQARDGDAALALASGHDGPIDLVLTDVVLPTMSGHDLAARLAATRSALKVIFTSGYSEESNGAPAEGAFLQKPFTLDALTAKVRDVLDAG